MSLWAILGGFFSGIITRASTLLAVFWLGKNVEKNKALEREIEQGRKDVERAKEMQRAEEAVRTLSDSALDERLSRFSRKRSTKP